jgi:5-deoxy-glucuronate isomerase
MNRDPHCPLRCKPVSDSGTYQRIKSREAGWEYLNFLAHSMPWKEKWQFHTDSHEMLIVLLGGNFSLRSRLGNWKTTHGRRNVFSGLPHAVYLPPGVEFEITAESEMVDFACGWCPAEQQHPARLITPEDVVNMKIEYRGGDNASRQINRILPPGAAAQRLVSVEVYTPSGNWSSFPPHKHDTRKVDASGKVTEADLDEIYFYKTEKPEGFAFQKIYTDDRSLNEIAEARNNDVVLVPRGYHPVVAGHGYNVYYLNFLAGSDQSLANTDDPDHKWIYGTWKGMDPRLPIVTIDMNRSAT